MAGAQWRLFYFQLPQWLCGSCVESSSMSAPPGEERRLRQSWAGWVITDIPGRVSLSSPQATREKDHGIRDKRISWEHTLYIYLYFKKIDTPRTRLGSNSINFYLVKKKNDKKKDNDRTSTEFHILGSQSYFRVATKWIYIANQTTDGVDFAF